MRRSPTDTTDNGPTSSSNYESLNMNNHDTTQQTYQSLNRDTATKHESMYEGITSKPPAKEPTSNGGYAMLGVRDESKTSYMTISHATKDK